MGTSDLPEIYAQAQGRSASVFIWDHVSFDSG